jgi:hypothetical protein
VVAVCGCVTVCCGCGVAVCGCVRLCVGDVCMEDVYGCEVAVRG